MVNSWPGVSTDRAAAALRNYAIPALGSNEMDHSEQYASPPFTGFIIEAPV